MDRPPTLYALLRLAAWSALAFLAVPVQAAALQLLMADETAAHVEFVQHLRDLQGNAGSVEVQRIDSLRTEPPAANPPAEEDSISTGVRTRSLRTAASPESVVVVAVGLRAARAALDRPGNGPLLLAMLSRLDYESLRTNPALRRPDRRVGVLLRDPALADQLALVAATLPGKHRLGVVTTTESEPLLRELRAAAGSWELQVEYAPDATSLAHALRNVLPRSDALIVLPDLIGDNQAAALAVLRAGAGAGVPVFGGSVGLVRSGALAAAVATPTQLASQARRMTERLAANFTPAGSTLVEAAAPATVRVNTTVARGLNLRLPDERELTERLATPR